MTELLDSPISLSELQRVVNAADPAAFLTPPRVLRRVIKHDCRITTIGLQVPHRKSYVISRSRLLEIVDRDELYPAGPLPQTVTLLTLPDEEDLAQVRRADVLLKFWRLLFHSRIHVLLEQQISQGLLTPAVVRRRIEAIGQAPFDEIRSVLRQEDFLLPPRDATTVYVEFAAVFLELRYFAGRVLQRYFPSIADFEQVEAILSEDVDGAAAFSDTRPVGAPDPLSVASQQETVPSTDVPDDEDDSAEPPPRSQKKYDRLNERADRAGEVGNDVRAALLRWNSAALATRKRAHTARAGAFADIDKLTHRLQQALDFGNDDFARWSTALRSLVEHGTRSAWSAEARLLFDLQKVCVDHERETFTVDLLEWARTLGRRPIRRPLPALREVQMTKHLRSAAKRLAGVRMPEPLRQRLAQLLHKSIDHCEHQLRVTLRPRIQQTFAAVGLVPANLPEKVGEQKLTEELLDRIVERGFLTMGDLRDTISRNNLKLPDLSGVFELFRGDPLLRTNRRLGSSLDGVYRRGEIYRRWLQRLSSLGFGNWVGRLLTLYLVLPFGGAFVVLEGLQHLLHMVHPPPHDHSIAYDADGRYVVTAGEQRHAALWDTRRPGGLKSIAKSRAIVRDVIFSPDGRLLAAASSDGSVNVYVAGSYLRLRSLPAQRGGPPVMAFNGDGRRLATSGPRGEIFVWNTTDGKLLWRSPPDIPEGAIPTAPEVTATDSDETTEDGEETEEEDAEDEELRAEFRRRGRVRALAFSQDGARVASGENNGQIWVWELDAQGEGTGQPLLLDAGSSAVDQLAFDPQDSTRLISASRNGELVAWNATSGAIRWQLEDSRQPLTSLGFLPGEPVLLTADMQGGIDAFDTESGNHLRTVFKPSGQPLAMAIDPDGDRLALATGAHVVLIIDGNSGETLTVLREVGTVQTPFALLGLGLFLLALVNFPSFRARALLWLQTARRFSWQVLEWCWQLWRHPWVRAVLESRWFRLTQRYVIKPAIFTALTYFLLNWQRIGWHRSTPRLVLLFLGFDLVLNSRVGRDMEEIINDIIVRFWRRFRIHVLANLYWLIVDVFRNVMEAVDRMLYAVDEWLRFKSGEGTWKFLSKAVLGLIWFMVSYVILFAINLLIEPQINPIKHFPVVTVSHKIILPLGIPNGPLSKLLEPALGDQANAVAGMVVFLIPGVFGFLVWELKENWRLYAANRPKHLHAVAIGHHGESVRRLLRWGLHSGTIPKMYAKLRRAERRALWTGNKKAARKYQQALDQVALALRRFAERELVDLLALAPQWKHPLSVGQVTVGTNTIRIEIGCADLAESPLVIVFEEQSGWIVAGLSDLGWVAHLDEGGRHVLANALAGFYQLGGVDMVREQIRKMFPPANWTYDIDDRGLVVWSTSDDERAMVYDLWDGSTQLEPHYDPPELQPPPLPVINADDLLFRRKKTEWSNWVEAWDETATPRELTPGVRILPPLDAARFAETVGRS